MDFSLYVWIQISARVVADTSDEWVGSRYCAHLQEYAAAKWTRPPHLELFSVVLVWVTIVFTVDSSVWSIPCTMVLEKISLAKSNTQLVYAYI
jgi:hypothetical protein